MGFFSKTDPLAKLTAEVEKHPKDAKLAMELAGMLKAKGASAAAVDQYLKVINLYVELGFATKAVAVAKQVIAFSPDVIEPHEFLARHYETNKLKEELRAELKTLVRLYGEVGRSDDASKARRQMDSLGPGR